MREIFENYVEFRDKSNEINENYFAAMTERNLLLISTTVLNSRNLEKSYVQQLIDGQFVF